MTLPRSTNARPSLDPIGRRSKNTQFLSRRPLNIAYFDKITYTMAMPPIAGGNPNHGDEPDMGWLERAVENAHTAPPGATWTVSTEPPSRKNGWKGATGEGNEPLLIG
jgi:hypothetical protein